MEQSAPANMKSFFRSTGMRIFLLGSVIVVTDSWAIESLRIVTHDRRIHSVGDCHLPGVVLAHSIGRATLS
jgi:hypothetical protein